MGVIQNDSFISSYYGDQIDLLLAAVAQANPLPSGTDWVAFIDDCRAAQTSAEDAQAAAEAAATAAQTWSSNSPYIGTNGDWYVYDATQHTFVDSGVEAHGPQGEPGETGAQGPEGQRGPQGAQGETGNGISTILKTGTSGLVDTYTITFTDGTTTNFTVTNGQKGDTGATGSDGVSPTVVVTPISGGHRITITDATGTQTFDVMDGGGSGDMRSSTYDPQGTVAAAGGIQDYVAENSSKPKQANVTLSATWSGTDPYTQTVAVSGVTSSSKIDIQPSAAQIQQLSGDGVQALYISNNNGTLTAYSIGAAPTVAMTIQCTVTEVNT